MMCLNTSCIGLSRIGGIANGTGNVLKGAVRYSLRNVTSKTDSAVRLIKRTLYWFTSLTNQIFDYHFLFMLSYQSKTNDDQFYQHYTNTTSESM